MSRVAILVPVYNVEQYVERCLRSLFEQTYSDVSYWILDDCSTDNSLHIVKQVAAQYPQREVHILQHDHNKGLAAARATLLDASQSDYVLQFDSDDFLDTDAVQRLMAEVDNTGADIVGMDCWFEWANQKKAYHAPWSEYPKEYTRLLLSGQTLSNVVRHLIKRSLYTDHDLRPLPGLNMAEDYLMMPRLCSYATRIAYVDLSLYHYWQSNTQSYTHQLTTRNTQSLVSVCQHLADFFADNPDYAEALNEGFWKKQIDLMMRVTPADYALVAQIPVRGKAPYAKLPFVQRIAAFLMQHHMLTTLHAYSRIYGFLFHVLQKLKGR